MAQNNDIKAIETMYAGCLFRSRLEARWAVFFDTLGVRWQYEPEGFEVGMYDEGNRRWYLPDFLLPDLNLWVEIKGDPKQFDLSLLEDCIDWNAGLPHVECECCEIPGSDSVGGLLLLSDIPRPERASEVVFWVLNHHKGVMASPFYFSFERPLYSGRFQIQHAISQYIGGYDRMSWYDPNTGDNAETDETARFNRALVAARSARFEHDRREQW